MGARKNFYLRPLHREQGPQLAGELSSSRSQSLVLHRKKFGFRSMHNLNMMKNIEHSVRLNNEAVSLLIRGNDRQAMESLKKAVSFVKGVVAKQGNVMDTTGASIAPCHSKAKSCCDSKAAKEDAYVYHDSIPLSNLADRHCHIYSRALTITFDKLPSDLGRAAQMCLAVVIFNLALSFHRQALRAKSKCLERAVSLYNMVIRLLRYSSLRGTAGLVKLATINNVSQLRYEQGNYALAREGLDHLSSLVRVTTAKHPQLMDCELQGVIMNVLFIKAPVVAPAA
jgi:hypothetical protein